MDSNKSNDTVRGSKAEKITKPFQLLAAFLGGVFALNTAFLTAARLIEKPEWVPGFLVVSAVTLTAVAGYGIFKLFTEHREVLLDDTHFSKGLTGENKNLQKKVGELETNIKQQTELASERLDMTQMYFEQVVSQLDIPKPQVKRLSRALRESLRAGEDLVTQEMSGDFLQNAKLTLTEHESAPSGSQFDELLLRISASRYERAFQTYGKLLHEDVTTVDLAPHLARVAAQVLGNRFHLSSPNPPIMALATLGILELVFTETMMNARDYSPSESVVDVDVEVGASDIFVRITNSLLPGTAQSDEWFEPGFRGAGSTERYATGAGQGLPLVRRLLSLISAEVKIVTLNDLCVLTIRFRNNPIP
nr:hypothetical protein [uncultured Janthinobacterium sp.]